MTSCKTSIRFNFTATSSLLPVSQSLENVGTEVMRPDNVVKILVFTIILSSEFGLHPFAAKLNCSLYRLPNWSLLLVSCRSGFLEFSSWTVSLFSDLRVHLFVPNLAPSSFLQTFWLLTLDLSYLKSSISTSIVPAFYCSGSLVATMKKSELFLAYWAAVSRFTLWHINKYRTALMQLYTICT